jgi:hypothetical protein
LTGAAAGAPVAADSTVTVIVALEAVASGTYIAEMRAGVARKMPGVVTFSR